MTLENFRTLREIREENKVETILQLKDVGIVEISTDQWSSSGCETCDYGSSYVTDLYITFDDGTNKNVEIDNMYNYVCSEQQLMQFFLNNIEALKETTKDDLIDMIKSDEFRDMLEKGGYYFD